MIIKYFLIQKLVEDGWKSIYFSTDINDAKETLKMFNDLRLHEDAKNFRIVSELVRPSYLRFLFPKEVVEYVQIQ